MVDATGTTKYLFDQLDPLVGSENGHKELVKYAYDLANEQTQITYPNTKAVTRVFDNDGRLETVTDWKKRETRFSYDPDSELSLITFPTEPTKDEDKYAYNTADQMTEVKMLKGAETLASLVYTRDNDGQVKKITSKGLPGAETTEITYDENNRLTKYGTVEDKYDAANNPTKLGTVENKFNEADELEKGATTGYSYDELDERTKETPEKGPATTFGYDQAGNLTAVERPEGESKPKIEDTYTYNGENLRTTQTINGATSYVAWDPTEGTPLLLSDGANNYIYGPEGSPVESINGDTSTYLHHDQQKSIRLLTGTAGTTTGTISFNAYGRKIESTGTTNPLGYDSQYTSTDTGLIYLRHRVYDPVTAQFTSRDPLASFTREPFGFAEDNPLNVGDPSGLFSIGEIPVIGESLEKVGTRTVGFFDGFTEPVFGGTAALRSVLGLNGGLNECSAEYQTANEIGGYTLDAEAVAPLAYGGAAGAGLALRGIGASEGEVVSSNILTQLASKLPDAEIARLRAAGFLIAGTGFLGYFEVKGLEAISPAKSSGCGCS